jgi:hypothetical protein
MCDRWFITYDCGHPSVLRGTKKCDNPDPKHTGVLHLSEPFPMCGKCKNEEMLRKLRASQRE